MENYMEFLDSVISRLREEERALAAADRKDEADLVKIRINVYDICRTIVAVLDARAFQKKQDDLREAWSKALEKAKAHGDINRAVIEQIKLEALADAAARFKE